MRCKEQGIGEGACPTLNRDQRLRLNLLQNGDAPAKSSSRPLSTVPALRLSSSLTLYLPIPPHVPDRSSPNALCNRIYQVLSGDVSRTCTTNKSNHMEGRPHHDAINP